MNEKRKFKRMASSERALLQGAGQNESHLLDISPGGMKVALDREVAVGTPITGQFSILPNVKPFFISGTVVWAHKTAEGKKFTVGIQFKKVSTIPL